MSEQMGKSKIVAAVLAFFLGWLGIHNFYLGYTGKGIVQLLLSTVGLLLFGLGPLIVGIWVLIEFIMLLVGGIKTDAKGVALA